MLESQDSLAIYMLLGAGAPVVAGIVFLIHELGHYVAARLCGVRVERFEIGIGREIHSWTAGLGTRWSLRIYPLCGLIHLARQAGDCSNGKGTFCRAPLWQRFVIILAGPVTNLLLAVGLYFLFFVAVGQPSTPPYVVGVEAGSPADEAGILPGDRMLEVDGNPVRRFQDVMNVFYEGTGRSIPVVVERGGSVIPVPVVPKLSEYEDGRGFFQSHGYIGIMASPTPLLLERILSVNGEKTMESPDTARRLLLGNMGKNVTLEIRFGKHGKFRDLNCRVYLDPVINRNMADPASAAYGRVYPGQTYGNVYIRYKALDASWAAVRETGRVLGGISHVVANLVGGDSRFLAPEIQVSAELGAVKNHLYALLHITALMSICIGLVNLLPFPGFDGCLLLLILSERVLGPERATRYKRRVLEFGFLFVYAAIFVANIDNLKAFAN